MAHDSQTLSYLERCKGECKKSPNGWHWFWPKDPKVPGPSNECQWCGAPRTSDGELT